MPKKFQQMNLPSFWMSYIESDDIGRTVERARELGGNVELGPQALGDGESIALIRDPLGAGFTVYEGNRLLPRAAVPAPGQMAWNVLYVSDAATVADFYTDLFEWRISREAQTETRCRICNRQGEFVSEIREQGDEERGGYEYWGVHFAVADPADARDRVSALGGTILSEDLTASGMVLAAQDPGGAAFYLVGPTQS